MSLHCKTVLATRSWGAKLINDKLRERGIILTDEQLKGLETKLENWETDSLTLNLDDDQLMVVGLSPDNHLAIDIDPADVEKIEKAIEKVIEEAIPSITSEVSDLFLNEWKKQAPSLLEEQRADRSRFAADHIRAVWGKAIDLLEILLSVTLEAGAEFNDYIRSSAAHDNLVLEVLTRLHARGCQVGAEILTLLKNGFADGAHARWRTLHEIAVTSYFISKHGKDVAERYLHHTVIDTYRAALKHQEHCKALNFEPITEVAMNNLKVQRDNLVARFGRAYRADYGWAANALGKDDPKFTAIEEDVGLEHLRPFYKLANLNVHAGSKGIAFRLGLTSANENLLLAGPSQFGLAEPGQNTAVSINQLTVTLLTIRPSLDRLTFIRATQKLVSEIYEAFLEIDANLEK